MIFFGHLGLTTGAVKVYEKVEKKAIDYRFVLIGSILPDIIDKPLSLLFLDRIFHNTRIYAHTLIFDTLLLLVGIYLLLKNKKNSIFLLAIGSSFHLLLDSMWDYKETLFWPYYGWKFPPRKSGTWLGNSFHRLVTDPGYYIPETLGFIIIMYLLVKLIKNKQFKNFIRYGSIK